MSLLVDGSPDSKLLVVLSFPEKEDVLADKPLQGPDGRILLRALKAAGIDRADCMFVNIIAGTPKKDYTPSPAELDQSWDDVDRAMGGFQGTALLVVGGPALRRCLGLSDGIDAWRGYLVSPKEAESLERKIEIHSVYKRDGKHGRKGDPKITHSIKVVQPVLPPNLIYAIPVLDPGGIRRSQMATFPALVADCRRARRVIDGQLKSYRATFQTSTLEPDDGPVAFDIETGGIDNAVTRIGLGQQNGTTTLRWDGVARLCANQHLSRPGRTKIAHNLSFDLPRLRASGVEVVGPFWDTMLGALMVQPDLYKGLEPVASLYLDCPRWKHLSESDPEFYNARDVSATLELYYAISEVLEKTHQRKLFENTIMGTVPTLIEMEQLGILVDADVQAQWTDNLRQNLGSAHSEWSTLTNGCDPFSHTKLKAFFYDKLGLRIQRNKYGGVTLDEGAIKDLSLEYPEHKHVLDLLLAVRNTNKDLETYGQVALSSDSCIHPQFLPVQKDDERRDPDGDVVGKGLAGTWRITAKRPNIQNQTPEARKMYIPRRGMQLVEADYNALEARIIAAVAHDEVLQEAIDNNLHEYISQKLGVDRTRAKNGFYGWSYRAGAPTLQRTFRSKGYNIQQAECKALLRAFEGLFKNASTWANSMVRRANTEFMMVNPFGLRRYWYRRGVGPAAANFIPQSSAAIMMWRILKPLADYAQVRGGHVLATIHDSVLCEMPLGDLEGINGIKEIMEQEFPEIGPGFRVPVKVKVGNSWGSMEPLGELR